MKKSDLNKFADRSVWVLDVDDCLYDIACGLHAYIKQNIVNTFNKVAANDLQKDAITSRLGEIMASQNTGLRNPRKIDPDELGTAFPPIVQTLSEIHGERLGSYIARFYGDQYKMISPCPDLTNAFKTAVEKGIGIYFYTNGPAAHLQKVLEQHGVEPEAASRMRDQAYDLLMSVAAGRGKPDPRSMQDFLDFSGVDPKKALMADDSVKNLVPAVNAGMTALWTWTSDETPGTKDCNLASSIGAVQIRHTGKSLLKIAHCYNR